MRIAMEIMLDKVADSPDGDPDMIAQHIDDEFMPAPGQHLFIPTDEGEAEYIVTSTNAWHEDMRPQMTEAQMHADQPEGSHRAPQHSDR
jgi:hypothetical protein